MELTFKHETPHTQKTVSLLCGQGKKILWIRESFVDSKKWPLILWNRFFHIKWDFCESTELF